MEGRVNDYCLMVLDLVGAEDVAVYILACYVDVAGYICHCCQKILVDLFQKLSIIHSAAHHLADLIPVRMLSSSIVLWI